MAEQSGIKHRGGKNDDVTVIVAQFSTSNQRVFDNDYEYFEYDKHSYEDQKDIMDYNWKPKKKKIEKKKPKKLDTLEEIDEK